MQEILNSSEESKRSVPSQIIYTAMGRCVVNRLENVLGYELKLLIFEFLNSLRMHLQDMEKLIYYFPRFIHSLPEESTVPKILLVHTMVNFYSSLKFIPDKRFCKHLSVENYLYPLIDKVFSSPNKGVLHLYLIRNLEKLMKLNLIFNVSFSHHESKSLQAEQIIRQKLFLVNNLKSKQFFGNWIQKLLQTKELINEVIIHLP